MVTVMDWRWCAQGWDELGDSEAAHRCLLKAEAHASHAQAWRGCATEWNQLLADEKAARRCLKAA
jgi:hypothetical protein